MEGKVKILVVDDEEVIRDMLTEHFSDEGYSVTAVPSGEAALEIFRGDPDHLVLADIRMPGMSGIDLLEEVKKLDPDAMVIMITSHASLESAVATMRAGAYDYIFKPFESLEQISHVAARAMQKLRLLRQNRALVEGIESNTQKIEKSSQEIEGLVLTDELTGFFNQRYLMEVLDKEVSRATRYKRFLSLIMLDVDHFQEYNDTHGSQAGDEVLRTMADLIFTRLRLADMPTRYSGEKFVLVLTETGWKRAKMVANDIRAQMEHYPFVGRETQPAGQITVSLGVAEFPANCLDSATLLKKAEETLERAKGSGKNQVICCSEIG
jgi:diguanylate cyclase (GGDEF)-like protein